MKWPRPAPIWLAYAAAGLALAAVFALYTEPGFLVRLSDQLWACF